MRLTRFGSISKIRLMNKYEITTKRSKLWVWYQGGKLKRLELRKGKVETLPVAIHHIPLYDNDMELLKQKYGEQVNYQLLSAQKENMYHRYVSEWFAFYRRELEFEPKFDGSEGKALKQIIAYLEKVSDNETEALAVWQSLLQNWHKLDDFYRKNMDLKFINSQLNKILINFRDATGKTRENAGGSGLREKL